jgi:hypothetical protein
MFHFPTKFYIKKVHYVHKLVQNHPLRLTLGIMCETLVCLQYLSAALTWQCLNHIQRQSISGYVRTCKDLNCRGFTM